MTGVMPASVAGAPTGRTEVSAATGGVERRPACHDSEQHAEAHRARAGGATRAAGYQQRQSVPSQAAPQTHGQHGQRATPRWRRSRLARETRGARQSGIGSVGGRRHGSGFLCLPWDLRRKLTKRNPGPASSDSSPPADTHVRSVAPGRSAGLNVFPGKIGVVHLFESLHDRSLRRQLAEHQPPAHHEEGQHTRQG